MTTFLEAMNEARERLGSDPLTFEAVNKKIAAARDLLAAGNAAWRKIKTMSVDLQFADVITTINVNSSSAEIPLSTLDDSSDSSKAGKVDEDIIKWIKAPKESGNGIFTLTLLTDERAEEIKAGNPAAGRPRFWYSDKDGVYVIPTPDDTYQLTMKYQKEYRIIKASTAADDFPGSQKWENVFIDGVEAYLKKKFKHTDADKAIAKFESNVIKTAKLLNKWKKKRDGHSRKSIASRKRARRWF